MKYCNLSTIKTSSISVLFTYQKNILYVNPCYLPCIEEEEQFSWMLFALEKTTRAQLPQIRHRLTSYSLPIKTSSTLELLKYILCLRKFIHRSHPFHTTNVLCCTPNSLIRFSLLLDSVYQLSLEKTKLGKLKNYTSFLGVS